MTPAELLFRTGQYVQKRIDQRKIGWQPTVQLDSLPAPLLPFSPDELPTVTFSLEQPVFRHTISINQPIDWHLDVSTGCRFPLTYAKNADVRSGQSGSAKYVWEINRLLFLPQLAVQYRQSGDAVYLERFVQHTRSWIAENPYLLGVNWYSNIEVSIRLINFFVAWNILDASALAQQNATFRRFVETEWLPTIYQHCVYCRQNPSYHSSANNHLISEYAGLFIAASFWQFSESAAWVCYAKAGLEREMQQQHSRHGVNREEAAEYIQFITDFFLIARVVADQTNNPFSLDYDARLLQVLHYIAEFLDCRGAFPRYGDEDDGRVLLLDNEPHGNNFRSLLVSGAVLFGEPLFLQRAANWGEQAQYDLKNYVLFGQGGRQVIEAVPGCSALPNTKLYTAEGHFIFRKQEDTAPGEPLREIYVHADAAPLGYLSIAAHGHADALSFLMHVDGQVFLADPGTYSYQTDPVWRNYFVSTRAHNTVCIDGQNQAFQAGPLLWLNHYQTQVLTARSTTQTDDLIALHNGYERLQCRHQRSFRFDKTTDTLAIGDVVENYGQQARQVEVMFHFGPGVRVETLRRNTFRLSHPGTTRQVWLTVASVLKAELVTGQTEPAPLGWYSDGFYRRQPTTTLRASLTLDADQVVALPHQLIVMPEMPAPETVLADVVTRPNAHVAKKQREPILHPYSSIRL